MVLRCMVALAFFLISSATFAHGTGQHVLGTVSAIDGTHIEVKTSKGAVVSVKLTAQTRFRQKGNPKTTERPAIGDRVVIEATKDNKTLTATDVHYSSAKKVPAPTR